MRLMYHVTTAANLPSIMREGVDPSYARQGMTASWYVPARLVRWAILHTMDRHNASLRDIRILKVNIDNDDLTHHGRDRWYCRTVQGPHRIVSVMPGGYYAE